MDRRRVAGDLSDWNQRGATWESGGGTLAAVSTPVRSGHYAIRAVVSAQPAGTISGAVVVAENMPQDAYYSAWFLVPDPVPTSTSGPSSSSDRGPWSMIHRPVSRCGISISNLLPKGSSSDCSTTRRGRRTDHAENRAHRALVPGRGPVSGVPAGDGELLLWLDDTLIFEVHGPTAPSAYVGWTIGGATEDLAAPQAALLLDDAAVTTRRLGTQFPPFYPR